MNTTLIVQIIASAVGTVGFAILFKVRAKYLALTALLGALCYGTYYAVDSLCKGGSFLAALCATVLVAALSEMLARGIRTPATVFMLVGLIPIVPGGALYHTMQSFITKSSSEAILYGWEALKIAMGIAGGIVAVSVLVNITSEILEKIKNQKAKNKATEDKK